VEVEVGHLIAYPLVDGVVLAVEVVVPLVKPVEVV
jgi:hypothetical protein